MVFVLFVFHCFRFHFSYFRAIWIAWLLFFFCISINSSRFKMQEQHQDDTQFRWESGKRFHSFFFCFFEWFNLFGIYFWVWIWHYFDNPLVVIFAGVTLLFGCYFIPFSFFLSFWKFVSFLNCNTNLWNTKPSPFRCTNHKKITYTWINSHVWGYKTFSPKIMVLLCCLFLIFFGLSI